MIGAVVVELPTGQGSLRIEVVMTAKDKVIHLHRRDPPQALIRLNRISGLRFARWPESLLEFALSECPYAAADVQDGQPLHSPEISSA